MTIPFEFRNETYSDFWSQDGRIRYITFVQGFYQRILTGEANPIILDKFIHFLNNSTFGFIIAQREFGRVLLVARLSELSPKEQASVEMIKVNIGIRGVLIGERLAKKQRSWGIEGIMLQELGHVVESEVGAEIVAAYGGGGGEVSKEGREVVERCITQAMGPSAQSVSETGALQMDCIRVRQLC